MLPSIPDPPIMGSVAAPGQMLFGMQLPIGMQLPSILDIPPALQIPTGTGPIPGFNFPLTSQLSIPPSVGGAQKRSLKSEKKGPPLKKHTINNLENECLLQAIKGNR